jgi:predicted transcriptional regulator
MPNVGVRKTKVVLSDYPYRKDIENRLSLSTLTSFEVDILHEILHHSLKYPIDQLAEALKTTSTKLIPILDKLSATKLFKRDNNTLLIDKEMRKYYEFQIERFDEDFEPNLDFIQNLLNKVPIHVLPNWYAISRSSDNIFTSIVEKYFISPKEYKQYLAELQFDDPVVKKIIHDIYHAPNFKANASDLIKKHKLTREQFEEYILLLEYHFICCLRYEQRKDHWEEVVTPFQEWLDYLLFEANSKPKPIQEKDQITQTCGEEFWMIKDLLTLINGCPSQKIKISDLKPKSFCLPSHLKKTIEAALGLEFIKKESPTTIVATENGLLWQSNSLASQAHDLIVSLPYPDGHLWTKKNIRLIEKSLKILHANEWVYLEDFILNFTATLGDREPTLLKNKGKKWKYTLPTYDPEELDFVRSVIMERLFELGIVSTGTHKGKECFCLTPYGSQFIH